MGDHRHYRYYVLGIFTLASILAIADRLILSILLEDIKAEFRLSDTQIGLLTGLAFTSFYILFSLPIARLADRHNRKSIAAMAVAAWSLMTALCGAALGFWTLFLARMGVGIGEAGGGPATMSVLSDYFRRHELARAMGIYSLGATLGTATGLMLGGYFADLLGWRLAFAVLGLPGILLGVLLYLTVIEPPRGRYSDAALITSAPSWRQSMQALLHNKTFVRLTIAYALAIVIGYGVATWLAAIMLRNFKISTADVGFYLGLAFVLGGIPGPLLGGFVTDKMARRNPKWRAWIPALAVTISLPIFCICLMISSFWPFLALFSLGYLIYLFIQPATLALIQLSVEPHQRAMAVASAMIVNNIIGQALGAYLIGATSEALAPTFGVQSLNHAVISICIIFGIPGVFAYLWTAAAIAADGKTSPPSK